VCLVDDLAEKFSFESSGFNDWKNIASCVSENKN
jgi:hypothetical protein